MCVIKRVTADDAVQKYTTAIQPSSGKRANLNTEAHCQPASFACCAMAASSQLNVVTAPLQLATSM